MDATDKQVPKCEISWPPKNQLLYLQKAHLKFKLVTYFHKRQCQVSVVRTIVLSLFCQSLPRCLVECIKKRATEQRTTERERVSFNIKTTEPMQESVHWKLFSFKQFSNKTNHGCS